MGQLMFDLPFAGNEIVHEGGDNHHGPRGQDYGEVNIHRLSR